VVIVRSIALVFAIGILLVGCDFNQVTDPHPTLISRSAAATDHAGTPARNETAALPIRMASTTTHPGIRQLWPYLRGPHGATSKAIVLSPYHVEFPMGGGSNCPPIAQSARVEGSTLIVPTMSVPTTCFLDITSFTVSVTLNRPVLVGGGLRYLETGASPSPRVRFPLVNP
jgi:hypothetical protein